MQLAKLHPCCFCNLKNNNSVRKCGSDSLLSVSRTVATLATLLEEEKAIKAAEGANTSRSNDTTIDSRNYNLQHREKKSRMYQYNRHTDRPSVKLDLGNGIVAEIQGVTSSQSLKWRQEQQEPESKKWNEIGSSGNEGLEENNNNTWRENNFLNLLKSEWEQKEWIHTCRAKQKENEKFHDMLKLSSTTKTDNESKKVQKTEKKGQSSQELSLYNDNNSSRKNYLQHTQYNNTDIALSKDEQKESIFAQLKQIAESVRLEEVSCNTVSLFRDASKELTSVQRKSEQEKIQVQFKNNDVNMNNKNKRNSNKEELKLNNSTIDKCASVRTMINTSLVKEMDANTLTVSEIEETFNAFTSYALPTLLHLQEILPSLVHAMQTIELQNEYSSDNITITQTKMEETTLASQSQSESECERLERSETLAETLQTITNAEQSCEKTLSAIRIISGCTGRRYEPSFSAELTALMWIRVMPQLEQIIKTAHRTMIKSTKTVRNKRKLRRVAVQAYKDAKENVIGKPLKENTKNASDKNCRGEFNEFNDDAVEMITWRESTTVKKMTANAKETNAITVGNESEMEVDRYNLLVNTMYNLESKFKSLQQGLISRTLALSDLFPPHILTFIVAYMQSSHILSDSFLSSLSTQLVDVHGYYERHHPNTSLSTFNLLTNNNNTNKRTSKSSLTPIHAVHTPVLSITSAESDSCIVEHCKHDSINNGNCSELLPYSGEVALTFARLLGRQSMPHHNLLHQFVHLYLLPSLSIELEKMAKSSAEISLEKRDKVNNNITDYNDANGSKKNETKRKDNVSEVDKGNEVNNVDDIPIQINEGKKNSKLMSILSSSSLLDLTSCFVRYAVSNSRVLDHLRLLWRVHLPHMSLQQLTCLLNVITNPIIPTGRLAQQKYYNSLNGSSEKNKALLMNVIAPEFQPLVEDVCTALSVQVDKMTFLLYAHVHAFAQKQHLEKELQLSYEENNINIKTTIIKNSGLEQINNDSVKLSARQIHDMTHVLLDTLTTLCHVKSVNWNALYEQMAYALATCLYLNRHFSNAISTTYTNSVEEEKGSKEQGLAVRKAPSHTNKLTNSKTRHDSYLARMKQHKNEMLERQFIIKFHRLLKILLHRNTLVPQQVLLHGLVVKYVLHSQYTWHNSAIASTLFMAIDLMNLPRETQLQATCTSNQNVTESKSTIVNETVKADKKVQLEDKLVVITLQTKQSMMYFTNHDECKLLQLFRHHGRGLSIHGFAAALHCLSASQLKSILPPSSQIIIVNHVTAIASSLHPSWFVKSIISLIAAWPEMIDELSLCKWLSRFTARDVVRQLDLYSVSLLLRALVRFSSFQSPHYTKTNNSSLDDKSNTVNSSNNNLSSSLTDQTTSPSPSIANLNIKRTLEMLELTENANIDKYIEVNTANNALAMETLVRHVSYLLRAETSGDASMKMILNTSKNGPLHLNGVNNSKTPFAVLESVPNLISSLRAAHVLYTHIFSRLCRLLLSRVYNAPLMVILPAFEALATEYTFRSTSEQAGSVFNDIWEELRSRIINSSTVTHSTFFDANEGTPENENVENEHSNDTHNDVMTMEHVIVALNAFTHLDMFDKPLFQTLTYQLWKCVEEAITQQQTSSSTHSEKEEQEEEEEEEEERMTQIRASIGTQIVHALSASSLASVLSSLLTLENSHPSRQVMLPWLCFKLNEVTHELYPQDVLLLLPSILQNQLTQEYNIVNNNSNNVKDDRSDNMQDEMEYTLLQKLYNKCCNAFLVMYGAFSESKTFSLHTNTKNDTKTHTEESKNTIESSGNEITAKATDNKLLTQTECTDKNAECNITSEEVCELRSLWDGRTRFSLHSVPKIHFAELLIALAQVEYVNEPIQETERVVVLHNEEQDSASIHETNINTNNYNYINVQVMNGAAYEVCTSRTCESTLPIQVLVDVCLSLCKVMMTCKLCDTHEDKNGNRINEVQNTNSLQNNHSNTLLQVERQSFARHLKVVLDALWKRVDELSTLHIGALLRCLRATFDDKVDADFVERLRAQEERLCKVKDAQQAALAKASVITTNTTTEASNETKYEGSKESLSTMIAKPKGEHVDTMNNNDDNNDNDNHIVNNDISPDDLSELLTL